MTVKVEIDDRLATLTYRPGVRNALSRQVLADLRAALHRLRDNDAVGVVAFTGAGAKAFVCLSSMPGMVTALFLWGGPGPRRRAYPSARPMGKAFQ